MKEAQIQSVALFFFYTFLDKSVALRATAEAVHLFNKLVKERGHLAKPNPMIVYATYKIWKKFRKKTNLKAQDFALPTQGWILPDGFKMERWRQFVKDNDAQLYLSVIWSQLLNFSEEDISEGLDSAPGSIRYRVGRGLKILGQLVSPTGVFDA